MFSPPRAIFRAQALVEWARGEVISSDSQLRARVHVPGDLLARARDNRLTLDDERELLAMIVWSRAPQLDPFFTAASEWFHRDVTIDEIASARTMASFAERAPGRRVDELALRPASPTGLTIVEFEPLLMGRPIFVAPAIDGPSCLVDGYRRCCELLLRHYEGAPLPSTFPAIVAVVPTIVGWPQWD